MQSIYDTINEEIAHKLVRNMIYTDVDDKIEMLLRLSIMDMLYYILEEGTNDIKNPLMSKLVL